MHQALHVLDASAHIRKYAHIFVCVVDALICSRIDFCNSLLIGLLKSHLAPLQSIMNEIVRLITRLLRFWHIPSFTIEYLHWHPFIHSFFIHSFQSGYFYSAS